MSILKAAVQFQFNTFMVEKGYGILIHHNLFITSLMGSKAKTMFAKNHIVTKQNCTGNIEK